MTTAAGDAKTEVVTMSTTASGVPVRVVPNGWRPKEDCLTLAEDELAWLDQFRARLLEEFADLVEDVIVYGYRTRGLADLDLRMDVLMVVTEKDTETEEQIRYLAYDLMLGTDASPIIGVLTKAEWAERKRSGGSFYMEAINGGISVL